MKRSDVAALLAYAPASVRARNAHVLAPAKPAVRPLATSARVHAVGLRLDVTLNSRGHWATKARRIKAQRATVAAHLAGCHAVALPCRVTITRTSPGALDSDNLVSSAKGVRDQIAEWLGVDDRDPRVAWNVLAVRGPWAVTITVETI